jgi:hypothetical protein
MEALQDSLYALGPRGAVFEEMSCHFEGWLTNNVARTLTSAGRPGRCDSHGPRLGPTGRFTRGTGAPPVALSTCLRGNRRHTIGRPARPEVLHDKEAVTAQVSPPEVHSCDSSLLVAVLALLQLREHARQGSPQRPG